MGRLTIVQSLFSLYSFKCSNMKKWIFLVSIIAGTTAQGQSLKDLLFSGKLKSDSNTVVKRTDDLSTKIDTTQKKAEPEKPKATAQPAEATKKGETTETAAATANNNEATATTDAPKETSAPARSNTRIWKDYTDSLVNTLKTEVLSNKKIKKDTYYVTVDYEADAEGQVTVTNVTVLPANPYLQDQLKQRLTLTPPQLAPTFDSANKARKVKRKYNFTVTKD
jgi:hypothetical protein